MATVAVPIFALVASGYAASRLHLLPDASVAGLNAFVYWFALPALLFVRVAETPILHVFDWRLLAAYHAGSLAVFALALLVGDTVFRARPAALGLHALAATFGNVGYMGLPLALTAFGAAATLPAVVLLVSDNAVTVSLAVAVVEAGRGGGTRPLAVARAIGRGLATNPLIGAVAAGAVVSMAGLPLPAPLRPFGDLLAGAALPCALFALGGSLVGQTSSSHGAEAAWLGTLKLAVHPLLVWGLATGVFALDPVWARVAVLQAAVPTAVTVFVLARRYDVWVEGASSVVLLTTLASVATLSFLLALLTR